MTESNNPKSRIFVYGFELEAPIFQRTLAQGLCDKGSYPYKKVYDIHAL